MRLVSWNINSIRLRMPLLKKLVDAVQPDIICLQETKVVDELFPLLDVQALGFGHVLFRGGKKLQRRGDPFQSTAKGIRASAHDRH